MCVDIMNNGNDVPYLSRSERVLEKHDVVDRSREVIEKHGFQAQSQKQRGARERHASSAKLLGSCK